MDAPVQGPRSPVPCSRAGRSSPALRARSLGALILDTLGRTLEHITVAGHPEPIPTSPVAAKLLQQRLDEAREKRGAEAAENLETLVGKRIGTLLEGGAPSIDLATMRSIVDYVEIPAEEDNATGLRRALRGVKEKLDQRGGPAGG
jgi:hypothetical protein